MAHNQNRDESVVEGSETLVISDLQFPFPDNFSQYVEDNRNSTNLELFSFLALMNAYLPESYLLMPECQNILGPPDPIHGGPPFDERMQPFTALINTDSTYIPGRVRVIDPRVAQEAVELLAQLRISKSATVKKLMVSLCGDKPQPHIIQFIKDLLTKRELGANGKEKFSRLITDILETENSYHAISVLKTASNKFIQNPIFPQTISRLYYRGGLCDYKNAEKWAKTAIRRAQNNSYVADTLGQVYKNLLMREAWSQEDVLRCAAKAFIAFKCVETKADNEEGPEMEDAAGTLSISNSFNNRGRFGFIQVAKITFEKLRKMKLYRHLRRERNLRTTEVQHKFDFFEWYLTYSKPDMTTLEPPYFWKDVVICYEYYTRKQAADSTSFPGLLDRLNRGLFISKGRRARFPEAVETVTHLEELRDGLKTTYERRVHDVKAAERYILSNIILSNKMDSSPQFTLVRELQEIIIGFFGAEAGRRSPEFYLLALLLFWPEEQPPLVRENDEEEEQQATEDDEMTTSDDTGDNEDNDEDQETRVEPVHLSLDLQQYVTFMREAFERDGYAKYLRGRYLLPLFFLGKGSGLNKWIHRSRLDAIVERKVDAELVNELKERNKKKLLRINEMWKKGEVWQVPEIQAILLAVRVELMPQDHGAQEVFVWAGGRQVVATTEAEAEASALSPVLFYLGFTIKGPVVFKVRPQKPVNCQSG